MFSLEARRNTSGTGRFATLRSAALPNPFGTFLYVAVWLAAFFGPWLLMPEAASSQTAFGEIEGRPAAVSRRQCLGGAKVGNLCNEDADCPGSTCRDRNLYNITVAVRFNATAAQITAIKNAFTAGSQLLFDVTDGQAQFGQVTILNNSTHSTRGHVWVTNTGGACGVNLSGTWGTYTGFRITAPIQSLQGANADGCIAHEFVHFAFDARDEYETAAVGCLDPRNPADCPDAGQGANSAAETECLMTCCVNWGRELCWGQAVGDNVTAGNHDATNVTEQSRCRSDRSCWEQVAWSWPETILEPAGAPDPGSNGLAHQALVFVEPALDARLVLVLDSSGSMSLETPSRLERLQTAALDIVDMAENGTELGLVSFSSTATDEVALAALGADRSDYRDAINDLTASGATNIGDGLQHAYNMITAAPNGVTADTAIILMTDGENNRPEPEATAAKDLQDKIKLLNDAGVPVYVTCTGDDSGLDSQCKEIGSGTGGSYVDSADAAELPERFVSFYELFKHRSPTTQVFDQLDANGPESNGPQSYPVEVEQGAIAVTFAVLWHYSGFYPNVTVEDPFGVTYPVQSIPQGKFARVLGPVAGTWVVKVGGYPGPAIASQPASLAPSAASFGFNTFVVRSYVENQKVNVAGGARKGVIQPGEIMRICASPIDESPLTGVTISGYAQTPSGNLVEVVLYDDGGAHPDSGDETADDGAYCANFANTAERGAYTFRLNVVAQNAKQSQEQNEPGLIFLERDPVDFQRLLEFSATVDDRAVPRNNPPIADAGPDQTVECTGSSGAIVTLDASGSYDPDGDFLTFTWTGPFGTAMGEVVPALLSLGTHNILLTADDGQDEDSEGLVVTVADTTPPAITSLSTSPDALWPPNHKMVPVTVSVGVQEACDEAVSCQVTSVSSNEPVNGPGDGNTSPDWEITDDLSVKLRAERSGPGSGRIYTLGVVCTDASGNAATDEVTVSVPHDQGKKKPTKKGKK